MSPRQPLPKDPIADARGQWERRGWTEEAAPMAAVTSIMRVQQILLARTQASYNRSTRNHWDHFAAHRRQVRPAGRAGAVSPRRGLASFCRARAEGRQAHRAPHRGWRPGRCVRSQAGGPADAQDVERHGRGSRAGLSLAWARH